MSESLHCAMNEGQVLSDAYAGTQDQSLPQPHTSPLESVIPSIAADVHLTLYQSTPYHLNDSIRTAPSS